jgi:hypothetical protein
LLSHAHILSGERLEVTEQHAQVGVVRDRTGAGRDAFDDEIEELRIHASVIARRVPGVSSGYNKGLMHQNDIALQIFCAMLAYGGGVSISDDLARKQIEIAFTMAETFIKVSQEREPKANALPPRNPDRAVPWGPGGFRD